MRVIHQVVYDGGMARTNVDVDERLVATVMERYRLDSKRAAIDLALRRLVGEPMSTNEILATAGIGLDLDNDEIEGFSATDAR
jgi:Arc/MetJ family transcription regulator